MCGSPILLPDVAGIPTPFARGSAYKHHMIHALAARLAEMIDEVPTLGAVRSSPCDETHSAGGANCLLDIGSVEHQTSVCQLLQVRRVHPRNAIYAQIWTEIIKDEVEDVTALIDWEFCRLLNIQIECLIFVTLTWDTNCSLVAFTILLAEGNAMALRV